MKQICGRCKKVRRMAPFKYEECGRCARRERPKRAVNRRTVPGLVLTGRGE